MSSRLNILVVGNCQAQSLAQIIPLMSDKVGTTFLKLLPRTVAQIETGTANLSDLASDGSRLESLIDASELVLLQHRSGLPERFIQSFPSVRAKLRLFPRIVFPAFHPDAISLKIKGPLDILHSSIVVWAWNNRKSVSQTVDLFRGEVYEKLKFFDYWEPSVSKLIQEGQAAELPLGPLMPRWPRKEAWMHTIIHPSVHVIVDLARAILDREGVGITQNRPVDVHDDLGDGVIWPVYPEIASRLKVAGSQDFKLGQRGVRVRKELNRNISLEDFVSYSFKAYSARGLPIDHPRLETPPYQELGAFLQKAGRYRFTPQDSETMAAGAPNPASLQSNPYRDLPDYRYWRRSIERASIEEVDPVIRSSFRIRRSDRVATAGSCFAQHISRTLRQHGFNYFVSEKAEGLSSEEAHARNYGIFTARYGNLYTARQLLQLFDRAYGTFVPRDKSWIRPDGRYADPFRPQIEPEGFSIASDLEASRAAHFAAVRSMFERLSVFVFTLGLTEAWRSKIDGAVFPLAPGVVAGEMDSSAYEFVNFGVSEVMEDLIQFVGRLRSVNPACRLVLTVSPVPLIATYEDRHVLISTTYSKSVLRVAAEEVCNRFERCVYFPSYEIITGSYARGRYFADDLRSVTPAGVNHVMRLFLKHYASDDEKPGLGQVTGEEYSALADIVCEEEELDGEHQGRELGKRVAFS